MEPVIERPALPHQLTALVQQLMVVFQQYGQAINRLLRAPRHPLSEAERDAGFTDRDIDDRYEFGDPRRFVEPDSDGVCTLDVPSLFSTVQEALDLAFRRPGDGRTVIRLESGYEIDGPFFRVAGGDYSHVRISSVDSVVKADAGNTDAPTLFGTSGSFAVIENCPGPVWDVLIDCENSGPADAKGITVVGANATLYIMPGKGLRNLGDRDIIDGPQPTQYGYGLLVWNGARCHMNSAEISGSAGRNLWASRGAWVVCAEANLTNARGRGGSANPQDNDNHGAIYCTRASWVNAEYSDISGAQNRGISCTRGYVNAEGVTADSIGSGDVLAVSRGGRINAYLMTVDGNPISSSDLASSGDEFNYLTGRGIYYNQDADPSVRSFQNPSANGNFVKFPDGTLLCYLPSTQALTLSRTSSASLEGTWTFPAEFRDTNYSISIKVHSRSFDTSKRGQYDLVHSNATTTGVTLIASSNDLWTSGDSCTVTAMAIGRWK